jgi:hypothetical protein
MRYLVGLVLMMIGGIHGYIFMETGTVDPCRGAVQRVIQSFFRRLKSYEFSSDRLVMRGAAVSN